MARLKVDAGDLVVGLAWWERIVARPGCARVPLAAVERVTVQPDWWRALRGVPVRGRALVVPGALCLGVWRHGGGRDLNALRPRRASPSVVVELRAASPYARIAVSSPQAAQTASAIGEALHHR
ncbi:hypothetical protein ACFY12_09910 [Streptomyces sp. NPDC001339]|uniref:hypothetical protein n=1 Tax=Streptomyces sp. NPDC001339 TaxID=3364563 RepID=UPI0036B295B1